jgi:hypothetical protein
VPYEPSEQDQKNDDGCEEARNEFEALAEVARGASIRGPTMCNSRLWGGSEAGKADHGSESIVGAWPVGSDGVEAGAADDATQHGGDDDGVVGITEDGHEVRDEINGNSEIGQQQHKPDAHPMREGLSAASRRIRRSTSGSSLSASRMSPPRGRTRIRPATRASHASNKPVPTPSVRSHQKEPVMVPAPGMQVPHPKGRLAAHC